MVEDQRGVVSTGTAGRSTRASASNKRTSLVKRLRQQDHVDPLKVVDEDCLFGKEVKSKHTVMALECSEVLRIDRHRFQEVLQARNARKATEADMKLSRDTLIQQALAASDSEEDIDMSENMGASPSISPGMMSQSQSDALRQQQMQHNAASAAVSAG